MKKAPYVLVLISVLIILALMKATQQDSNSRTNSDATLTDDIIQHSEKADEVQSTLAAYQELTESKEGIPSALGEQLKREVFTAYIGEEELLFEIYKYEQGEFIQPQPLSSSPIVYSDDKGKTSVFIYNQHLYKFDSSLTPIQLTNDRYYGFTKEAYWEKFDGNVFWAEAPSVSPDGNYVVYYSNRSILNGEPNLSDSLWLYDLSTDTEKELFSNNNIDNDAILSPYVQWADEHIIVEIIYPNTNKYKFVNLSLEDNKLEELLEIPSYISFENGYVVYRLDDHVHVFNTRDRSEQIYKLPEAGYEHMVVVSQAGNVAYPYKDKINILLSKSGEILSYPLPQSESIYLLQRFVTDNDLLLTVQQNSEKSSWLLDIGENFTP